MALFSTVSRLLLPALLLTATAASAQTTYRLGLRGGLNVASVTQEVPAQVSYPTFDLSQHKSARLAGQLGLVAEAQRGALALQTGLLFSLKGTVIKGELTMPSPNDPQYEVQQKRRTVVRYHCLEVPLNVVYSPGRSGLQLFAGPYAAVAVGGKARFVDHNTSADPDLPVLTPTDRFTVPIDYDPKPSSSGAVRISTRYYASKRFDAGFNAGIGYRRGPVQVQANYGFGLLNLDPYKDWPSLQGGYNRVAQLTGTYFFGQ